MKVMVVNNDDLIHSQLIEFLGRSDEATSIKKACTYKEAIDGFNIFSPDIVFLDLALYDAGLIQLPKKFKKLNPSVKVIFMVSSLAPQFKKACLKLGADDFLDKTEIVILNAG